MAIARALVNDPEMILADEPTGNLELEAGLEILAIFQELNRLGKTVVLITHDAAVATMAKRVVEIVDGRIVSDTSVEESQGRRERARSCRPENGGPA